MIYWKFHINRNGHQDTRNVSNTDIIQLNETDFIDIDITLTGEDLSKGAPRLIVGDVPLELNIVLSNEEKRVFRTSEPTNSHDKQIFYNYFGESEILLYFENGKKNDAQSLKVDIRARKANAELAERMINFISENMDDAVLLCFSKSHMSSGVKPMTNNDLTKFQLLKETVGDLVAKQGLFLRDHKYTWQHEMTLSNQGQSSGPDSVYYLLKNLDKVTPSSSNRSNIKINNRSYMLDEMPSEILVSNSDVFENRVIFSFLFSAKQYLQKLKKERENQINNNVKNILKTDFSDDYISFDNVLRNYKISILKHHIEDIHELSKQIGKLISFYKETLKTTLVPQLRPKMTPYIASRPHYRIAFNNIHQWYLCNAPDLKSNSFLMGLRNLSTIYELICLLIINRVITNEMGFKHHSSEYVEYGEDIPYSGRKKERPNDIPNNAFNYSKGNVIAKIRYEPKIYQYRRNISQPFDLINVSNAKAGNFGLHYFCPDYVIQFSSEEWAKDLVLILDAKYQNYENVMKYSLPDCEQKYLRDIFTLREDMSIGESPVKLLILLYAHGTSRVASRLNKIHQIGEELAVYPQAIGLKTTPDQESEENLRSYINNVFNLHEKYAKRSNYDFSAIKKAQ